MSKTVDPALQIFAELVIEALIEKYGMPKDELCDLFMECCEAAQIQLATKGATKNAKR